jgi:hypothetical protein
VPRWTSVEFKRSAAKHGVSYARSWYVVDHPLYEGDDPTLATADPDPARVLFIGWDPHGILLEVVGVDLDDGRLLVIHAMKLRRRYRDWLEST